MFKSIAVFLIILASSFFLYSPPPKSSYHSLFLSLSDNVSISNHLYTLTHQPHIAGSEANAEAANYVLSVLNSSDIVSHLTSYDVLLSYPESRSLILIPPLPENPKIFNLLQEVYIGHPYVNVSNQIVPTFHAYAKSGSVVGALVYVNYGRLEDYEVLKEMGINVTGNVVLARYGKIFRGDIVKNACEKGAIGALVFTDKKDYGCGDGDGGGGRWFPDEKWMPPSGVQVGTVYGGLGDPSTPGWVSSSGQCERISEEEIEKSGDVPLIPSLPISGADGEALMRSIGGEVANEDWQGREDAPVYRVGPGPGIVNLTYYGKNIIKTIQNVIGLIEGEEEPDRFVILGNHRDAWTFGAVDPNSGTAVLLEVAQRLKKLQERGWKPRRTIVFCNWDAEEYGLIGSTEWVEENRELLSSRAVAYINVDSAVYEPGVFVASATPQLDELIKQASQLVPDPDNSSQTVYESWFGSSSKAKIGRLGSGQSDFAAFLQHAGIPAADMSFGEGYPVYHSMYDDFVWMKNFGDPMFQRHVAVASIWGLVTLRLADEEFLPFNYLSYAYELQKYAEELKDVIKDAEIDLTPLFNAIEEFEKAATKIKDQIKALEESKGWIPMWKRNFIKVRELNDRLIMAERAFTDDGGLFGRTWYKHLIYGPSKHDDYGSVSYPGIYDAIEEAEHNKSAEAWQFIQHQVWRVARAVKHASLVLYGELT